MLIQGQVGQPAVTSIQAGATPAIRQGQLGDVVVSELHGRYYEQSYRRNMFTAYSGGTAMTQAATGLVGLQLWNPSFNVNLVLTKCAGFVAVTSATTIGVVLSAGTGQINAPTSVTTVTNVQNQFIGAALPIGKAYNAGTFVNAPTPFWPLLHNTAAIASTGEDPGWQMDFEGSVVVPPQSYVAITALSATAGAAALYCALMWEEVPV